ncbi:hypothetical protein C8Q77DRAFT_1077000 [Trametes polyzona]|nr:hypothetical protein C8Q77DRAFT_1077000 [Trametes polyzona]
MSFPSLLRLWFTQETLSTARMQIKDGVDIPPEKEQATKILSFTSVGTGTTFPPAHQTIVLYPQTNFRFLGQMHEQKVERPNIIALTVTPGLVKTAAHIRHPGSDSGKHLEHG